MWQDLSRIPLTTRWLALLFLGSVTVLRPIQPADNQLSAHLLQSIISQYQVPVSLQQHFSCLDDCLFTWIGRRSRDPEWQRCHLCCCFGMPTLYLAFDPGSTLFRRRICCFSNHFVETDGFDMTIEVLLRSKWEQTSMLNIQWSRLSFKKRNSDDSAHSTRSPLVSETA